MKINKKIIFIIITLMVCLMVNDVKAATLKVFDEIKYDNQGTYQKKLDSSIAFCISGFDVPVTDNDLCNESNELNNLTAAQRAYIGQIITLGCVDNSCSAFGDNYVITEAAIIEYIRGINSNYIDSPVLSGFPNLNTKVTELLSKVNLISGDVLEENGQIAETSFDVEFSADHLIFTKEGNIYKSQTVEVNGISYANSDPVLNISDELKQLGVAIVGDYKSFYITVPDKDTTKNIDIMVTVSATQKTSTIANLYACNASQDVATLSVGTKKGDDIVSGKIISNKVKISKTSVATSKELPGATLEILDEKGNIVKYCTDKDGNKNTECKWVSTDKPYEIEGMPNGKYYLVETLAPEGYALSKEKIEFIVDGSKEIVEVEMKNNLEVKVPDTLSSRSVLLIAISMFDIALGIGILTYVRKNKVEE